MQTISSLALAIISTFQYVVALTQAANRAFERRIRSKGSTSTSRPSRTPSTSSSEDNSTSLLPGTGFEAEAHEDTLAPSLKLISNLIQADSRLPTTASLFLLRLVSRLCQPWLERYLQVI
jgi:hypothetical protein